MDCGAFDSGLTIHPDGKVSPCCLFEKQYFKNLQDIDLTNPWEDIRDGKGCEACNHAGPTYKDRFDKFKNNTYKVRHLDVRNNNLCNLECTICCSYYSSKWAERLGEHKFVSTEFDIDLDDVEHIYFAGGEPLINPTHWKVLDQIKEPKNVSLQYNSNLGVVKNIDTYWPKFKKVTVDASMDAVGQLGENLRYGTKWDKWVENLYFASNYSTITLNPTVSVLNIFNLQEIEEWSDYPIHYNILTNPQHLCVSVLPKSLKDKIPFIPNNEHLRQLLDIDESWLFPHTMSFIMLQDKIKNTNVWEKLPFTDYAIAEYMKEGL